MDQAVAIHVEEVTVLQVIETYLPRQQFLPFDPGKLLANILKCVVLADRDGGIPPLQEIFGPSQGLFKSIVAKNMKQSMKMR